MNRCPGDMEGIDSSYGWYLKYIRNHLRQFFGPSGIIVAGNSYHWFFSYSCSCSVKRYSHSKFSVPEKGIDLNRFRRFRVADERCF